MESQESHSHIRFLKQEGPRDTPEQEDKVCLRVFPDMGLHSVYR